MSALNKGDQVRVRTNDGAWTTVYVRFVWPLGFAWTSRPWGSYGELAFDEEGELWERLPAEVMHPELRPELEPES